MRIVQIGNFRGVRISKALLERTQMTEDVQIEAWAGEIVIRSMRSREGWEETFRLMAKHGDDRLLDDMEPTSFDDEEWDW